MKPQYKGWSTWFLFGVFLVVFAYTCGRTDVKQEDKYIPKQSVNPDTLPQKAPQDKPAKAFIMLNKLELGK